VGCAHHDLPFGGQSPPDIHHPESMRISFSTLACPDWSWREILTHGPAFGYDGVEVRLLERDTDLLQRPEFQPSQLAARRRELSDSNFRIAGLASSVRFDYADAAERTRQVNAGRAYLDLAAELGAECIRVFGDVVPPPGDPRRAGVIGHIADGLQALGEHAEPLGLAVLIETHGDFFDSRLVAETLFQVASPAVGVLWDTHHPWRFLGEPIAESFQRLQPWIRIDTHWKDSVPHPRGRHIPGPFSINKGAENPWDVQAAAAAAHALMSGHRHADYVLFGGGEFPIAECLRLLLDAGYDGWFCYEWEYAWHPEIEPPEVALPLFPGKLRWFAER
jgi:sugar phosphate isomerase/epimerase